MTDRRTTLKWIMAASAVPLLSVQAADEPQTVLHPVSLGYGTDPDLLATHHPGDLWPLTFDVPQRQCAAALSDAILPGDARSPSAAAVGVVDFLDEWVSAPYQPQRADRAIVLPGLAWIDGEATARFGHDFAGLSEAERHAICDDICYEARATPALVPAARFFARFRALTIAGFYSTPAGRADLGYVGNVPLARFDPPPLDLLRRLGLEGVK